MKYLVIIFSLLYFYPNTSFAQLQTPVGEPMVVLNMDNPSKKANNKRLFKHIISGALGGALIGLTIEGTFQEINNTSFFGIEGDSKNPAKLRRSALIGALIGIPVGMCIHFGKPKSKPKPSRYW